MRSEASGSARSPDRAGTYSLVVQQARALLDPWPGPTAAMASAAALLRDAFDHVSWVGFYLPAEDGSLVVGPYQGPLACIRLPAGRGVCHAAAASLGTVVVPDVHAFPGHIACDTRSRSEIVVPLVNAGRLLAVLDVDSREPDAFGDDDRRGLEAVAERLSFAWTAAADAPDVGRSEVERPGFGAP